MKKLFAAATSIAAMGLLLAFTARADRAMVEGIVVPDNLHERQPFSFAATPVIEGEVVSIQTVSGVVVQRSSVDKYGRIFLSAGLPAGAYLISASGHDKPVGRIEIQHRAADVLEPPQQGMRLQNSLGPWKVSEAYSLEGHGFSSNYAAMQLSLTGSGKTEAPIVLAATEDQLKLAPITQLSPGMAQLRITNNATGESTEPRQILLYDIQGKLQRHKLTSSSNDQTQLVVRTRPEDIPLKVRASVVSGPVDFGGGRREAEAVTRNGKAIFPVHAEHGSGPFQLAWELVLPITAAGSNDSARAEGGDKNVPGQPPDFPDPPSPPASPPHQDHGRCACTVTAGGGTANLDARASERPAPKDLDLSAVGNQQQQDDWARRRKDRPMFDNYLGTVKVTFDILSATVVAVGDSNDQLHVQRNTWLTITGAANVQFQIFRKGNNGYLPINSRGDNMTLRCPRDQKTFKGINNEEYLIELWVSKSANAPATTNIQVDVGDAITPCGFARHQTASYALTFNQMGVSKVRKVE